MFTGIITHQGMVVAREALPAGLRLEIACGLDLSQVPLGASIACDGVCLTVISTTDKSFTAEVSEETLSKTTLGSWQIGYQMNLERAIQAGGEFGGHFVTGHVDAVGSISRFENQGTFWLLEVSFPPALRRYFAEKGSVTINGVSLTVNSVSDSTIGMTIIPHTAAITNIGKFTEGGRVNLEVDLIARYIAPYLQK
jgi:riboflavin synthase